MAFLSPGNGADVSQVTILRKIRGNSQESFTGKSGENIVTHSEEIVITLSKEFLVFQGISCNLFQGIPCYQFFRKIGENVHKICGIS